jgi:hypothetical protein
LTTRDHVALGSAAHHQARDDRQRQRDADPERRAEAEGVRHLDPTADALDVGLDDVHADTAAGDVGDPVGGAEARLEDQPAQLLLAHPGGILRGDRAALDRPGPDGRRVQAAAVVRDLDDDLASLVEGAQSDGPLGRLADGDPLLRRLDPVVDAVAHQVGEGVADRLEDGLVQLGLPALGGQRHLLATGLGEVADDAGELLPQAVDRLHARLHDPLLQLRGDGVETVRGTDQRHLLASVGEAHDLVAREHQLADERHQLVEQTDVHPQGAAGHGRRGRHRRRGGRGHRGRHRRRGRHGRLRHHRLRRPVRQRRRRQERRLAVRLGDCGTRPVASGRGGGRAGALGRDRHERCGQPRQQLAVVAAALGAVALDVGQQAAHEAHHVQQRAGHLGVGRQRPVAQGGQQVLRDVRDRLDARVPQEAAGALEGVDRAEDAADQLGVRLLLEREQVTDHLVQDLVALDDELLDDLAKIVQVGGDRHGGSSRQAVLGQEHCTSASGPVAADL